MSSLVSDWRRVGGSIPILVGTLVAAVSVLGQENVDAALKRAGENQPALVEFLESAKTQHGDFGARAANFLVSYMPEDDLQSLSAEFLIENLDYALRARSEFPWGDSVSEALFFNDVLPYASLDETREPWRPALYEKAKGIVQEADSMTEAVQLLNRDLFNLIDVHYNTGRKAPNQSPDESIQQGRATCTGLSIILVDACRAVGIPARVTGTPLWTNNRGNHTWTEVWDGGWHFLGSDEYNANGLDRGWFVGAASKADKTQARYSIYSTSWKPADTHFPMVWNRQSQSVHAFNVTDRYAATAPSQTDANEVFIRVRDQHGGERLAVKAELLDENEQVVNGVMTKAGRADMNDIAALSCRPDASYWLRLTQGDEQRQVAISRSSEGPVTLDLVWAALPAADAVNESAAASLQSWIAVPRRLRSEKLPETAANAALSLTEAAQVIDLLWNDLRTAERQAREAELEAKAVRMGTHELKIKERRFGEAPEGSRSLWISMHGGGGAPPAVNDRQWQNQIGLYEPEEGFYVAPRAPTDTWNLWHRDHIDPLFQRLIENYVICRGVDPNRIYLMGYSAGGDGVFQLGPRMADRWAAAAMMAGHPNETKPVGLRNIGFGLFMGGDDAAYKRNEKAHEWKEALAKLRETDPAGYQHMVRIYPDTGHWMNRRDREALPWMKTFQRNPWPQKIEWLQDDVVHERFYWLEVSKEDIAPRQQISAEIKEQKIEIHGAGLTAINLRLSDALLNLNEPVEVIVNGESVFSGKVERTVEAIRRSLEQRADPADVATAYLSLRW